MAWIFFWPMAMVDLLINGRDKPHYENVPFEIPESWVWTTIDELFFGTKLAGFEFTEYFTKENVFVKYTTKVKGFLKKSL